MLFFQTLLNASSQAQMFQDKIFRDSPSGSQLLCDGGGGISVVTYVTALIHSFYTHQQEVI